MPIMTPDEIRDLESQGRVKYIKQWTNSGRRECLERLEWYTQIKDLCGVSKSEIDMVVFNQEQLPSGRIVRGDCQLPAAKYYVEIA